MIEGKTVKEYSKSFWKFASQTQGVYQIEDVFLDWAKTAQLTLPLFRNVWSKINLDIDNAFSIKEADLKPYTKTKLLQDLISNYNKYLFGIGREELDAGPITEEDLQNVSTEIPEEAPMSEFESNTSIENKEIDQEPSNLIESKNNLPKENVGRSPKQIESPNKENDEATLTSSLNIFD